MIWIFLQTKKKQKQMLLTLSNSKYIPLCRANWKVNQINCFVCLLCRLHWKMEFIFFQYSYHTHTHKQWIKFLWFLNVVRFAHLIDHWILLLLRKSNIKFDWLPLMINVLPNYNECFFLFFLFFSKSFTHWMNPKVYQRSKQKENKAKIQYQSNVKYHPENTKTFTNKQANSKDENSDIWLRRRIVNQMFKQTIDIFFCFAFVWNFSFISRKKIKITRSFAV